MTAIQPINAPQPHKLTLEEFTLLIGAGELDEFAKSELIEGVIYTMNAQFRSHSYAKNELTFRLRIALDALANGLMPQSEATVAMPPNSAPEPDIVVTSEPKGGRDFIPLGSVGLAIEISDSSARFDLTKKAALYARHGVPEYWVLDLPKGKVRQFWSPAEGSYLESRSAEIGEPLESLTIAGLIVASGDLN